MSHSSGADIAHVIKSLLKTAVQLLALALTVAFRLTGLLLIKISELFEKLSGHGTH